MGDSNKQLWGPNVQTQAVQSVLPGMGVDPGDSSQEVPWALLCDLLEDTGGRSWAGLQAGGGDTEKTVFFWVLFPTSTPRKEGAAGGFQQMFCPLETCQRSRPALRRLCALTERLSLTQLSLVGA